MQQVSKIPHTAYPKTGRHALADGGAFPSSLFGLPGDIHLPGTRFYFVGGGSHKDPAWPDSHRLRWHDDLPGEYGVVENGQEMLAVVAGGIAHHMGNLFQAVLGQIGLIRLDTGTDAAVDRHLVNIDGYIHYGSDLVRHLLGLAGRGIFCDAPFDADPRNLRSLTGRGFVKERFRSFPFYHLVVCCGASESDKPNIAGASRQLAMEFRLLFEQIGASLDALERLPAVPSSRIEAMHRIARAGDRVVNELAFFAGIGERLFPKTGEGATDVNRIVSRYLKRFRQAPVPARITSQLDPLAPGVAISAEIIEDVFAALVANALDAMPTGGVLWVGTRRVSNLGRGLAAWETGPGIELIVNDTGVGIAPEDLSKICVPFFTRRGGRARLGLGLSGAYGRVRAAGGKLEVASSPGQGTTVRITIPCARTVGRSVSHFPVSDTGQRNAPVHAVARHRVA